ncbi:MAG: hypothetical protein ACJAUP_001968 [Cellvibrionaceae bacterium]|jgi:hypothetical protein
MNWQFTTHNILCELQSGYEIHLAGGTWLHPKRLKPLSSKGIEFPDQLSLLRSGLQYIKSIGNDRNQNIERSITTSLLAG